MRYVNILALHFEDILQERSRAFVYFILNILNPLIIMLFWNGVSSKTSSIAGFTRTDIVTYYLLMMVVVTFVESHVEDSIAKRDIKEGGLVSYLLRPFSYVTIKFFQELPHRLLQGMFGIMAYALLMFTLPVAIMPHITIESILLLTLSYILSFFMMSSVSLIAFWFIEIGGLMNTLDVMKVIFSGLLLPIAFLPSQLMDIALLTPFPYMLYFPTLSLQGKGDQMLFIWAITMQCIWVIFFVSLHKVLWYFGIRKFSGVGQ